MRLHGDDLRSLVEQYATEITQNGIWKFEKFFIGTHIPNKKLKNAMSEYAQLTDEETPLILFDYTTLGSAKEGMLLTTSNLYYNCFVILDKAKKKGSIPLSDIQSAFFDMFNHIVSDSNSMPLMTFFLNRQPFSFFPGLFLNGGYDSYILDKLFSKLNSEYVDIKVLKPIWLYEREELLYVMSSDAIESTFNGISGQWSIKITNARIVGFPSGDIQKSSHYSPELFFNTIELSLIRNITAPKYTGTLVLEFYNGIKVTFKEKKIGVVDELHTYIKAAMERMIPVITFKDPEEKVLYSVRSSGSFGSEAFWELVFGDKSLNVTFCITNKRLLCYHIEQVSGITRSDYSYSALKYNITPPMFKWCWLPLSEIISLTREKKAVFHYSRLLTLSCAPVGGSSPFPVIPAISDKSSGLLYDPINVNTDASGGSAIIDFSIFDNITKENRKDILDILQDLKPHMVNY